ncbi:MAG: glycosyltransferase family 4 protein [Ferruginibacter sp.]|nr:glycosyltransferase family 4 protein [Ferruginibacter sp.]
MPQLQRKIRVLECIRQGQIGGGESHLLSLVENLDRNLYEPVVLSFTDGPMIDRLKAMNVPTHIIHTEKPFDIRKWKKVKQLILGEKIDLVHAHGTRANSNVFWAAKSLKLPIIYTVHGWSFHGDQHPLVRKIRVGGEKLLTSKMDVNISVSDSNKKSGQKYLHNFNSEVINNGIDRKRFNPQGNFKNIREELGISSGETLVLFIARFTSHKQPLALLKAFAVAVEKNPSLKLLMVGDGDEKAEALQLVKQLGIQERVIFQSFRQDVPDVLAAADIFVLPSLWEGLPIGLLEAMSMGKAVIGTNVDGTCEVIEHKKNGLLIELSNLTEDLAAAIVQISTDEQMRKEFETNAVLTVKNKFDAAAMTRQIETVYAALTRKDNHHQEKVYNGV